MEKRGQVTAFIIIGVAVLIIIGLVFGIKYAISKDLFKNFVTKETSLPSQLKPIEQSITSCVGEITKQGVLRLGLQGGFLDLPEDNIPNTPFTPLQRNLEIIPDTDLKAAVWLRERGNGIQETNIPSKQQMEEDLEEFINNNFKSCALNLSSFYDQGYKLSTTENQVKTKVSIQEEKILVTVNFPLTATIDKQVFTLDTFSKTIDSSLGRLHNLALQIFKRENTQLFLEEKTIDTLVAYDPEIPFSGLELICNQRIWSKTEVVTKLKNVLFENVAMMNVKGTKYEGEKEFLTFDILENNEKDIAVNFMYIPSWPTVVEIEPSEGDILQSDPISKKTGGLANAITSSLFCMSNHHFVYDIKYPVLIILKDEQGLVFQFATQVIIDNNQARINAVPLEEIPTTESEICKYPTTRITVETKTFAPNGNLISLKDAEVSLKCFPASCPLGISNAQGMLQTISPACFNGIIEGQKEGFYKGKSLFSTTAQGTTEVLLEPFYKKKIIVKLREKDTGEIREPYESESVFINFNHKDTTYTTSFQYPGEENELDLIVGTYDITASVFGSSTWPVVLPEETITKCIDVRASGLLGIFKTEKKCLETKTEKFELEEALKGGAHFEYVFERTKLANENALVIYVLVDKLPSSLEYMQQIQLSLETNKDHQFFKEPELQ